MQDKTIQHATQIKAVLGLGAILLGAVILTHSETEEGTIAGAVLTLGGLSALSDPKVITEISKLKLQQ